MRSKGAVTTIYFIQRGEDGPIKIGQTSKDPQTRVAALQIGSAEPLRLLGFFRSKESKIHEMFREHRMSGEWFRPHPEILTFIEAKTSRPIATSRRQKDGMQIATRVSKSVFARILERRADIKRSTGIEPSVSAVMRTMLEEVA